MSGVSLTLAAVTGGLSVLNPCGFPLLPSFLSFYASTNDRQLPTATTRVGQGLHVGVLVTAGFLGVTTNRSLPAWGEIFGDSVVASAILDRLMHNAIVFNIKGESWRLREHQALTTTTTEPRPAITSPAGSAQPPPPATFADHRTRLSLIANSSCRLRNRCLRTASTSAARLVLVHGLRS